MNLKLLAEKAHNKLFIVEDTTPDSTFEEGGKWKNGCDYVRDNDKGIDFVEQNPDSMCKWSGYTKPTKWAQMAKDGHNILWGIDDSGDYMVRVVDGEITQL